MGGGFWAKAAAFLLAVVLVPVLLSYGAALAFSYSGELRGDFYESSICSSAVYREMSHVYDSYHYYVENGQTEVLAKYDDWYPPTTATRTSVFRSRTRRAPSSSITTAQATFP